MAIFIILRFLSDGTASPVKVFGNKFKGQYNHIIIQRHDARCKKYMRMPQYGMTGEATDKRPLRSAEALLSYEGGDSVTIDVLHLSVIYDTG